MPCVGGFLFYTLSSPNTFEQKNACNEKATDIVRA